LGRGGEGEIGREGGNDYVPLRREGGRDCAEGRREGGREGGRAGRTGGGIVLGHGVLERCLEGEGLHVLHQAFPIGPVFPHDDATVQVLHGARDDLGGGGCVLVDEDGEGQRGGVPDWGWGQEGREGKR